VTPHLLLLTSAQEVGGPMLIPIHAIDYLVPLGQTSRVFLTSGQYLDVVEDFRTIVYTLGGLVMKPIIPTAQPPRPGQR
jgi:hypothetical protein